MADKRGAYRVLVTGSRDWAGEERIHGALDALLACCEIAPRKTLVVVHGACLRGADEMARKWALAAIRRGCGVRTEPHPADWRRLGKSAGFLRNAGMVSLGADLCLAFIRNGSRGATHCAGLAEKAGIEVRRFTDQGGESAP